MTVQVENTKARILIADDEDNTRMVLTRALELTGFSTLSARNGTEVLQRLSESEYDLLLLDLHMPEIDGEQVMETVRELYPNLAVIVLTAHASLDSAIAAVKAGAVDYLLKPQSIPEIHAAIERALKWRQARIQRHHLIGIISDALHALEEEEAVDRRLPYGVPSSAAVGRGSTVRMDPEKQIFTVYPGSSSERRSPILTANQVALISYMILHPDNVLSNRELAQGALGYNDLSEKEAESIIRPHIVRLRKKIEIDPEHPTLIQTIRSKGYMFCSP